MIKKLKFKKLLNEYKSHKFELEMVREILKDAHLEFEVFYRRWCAENDVDIAELNKQNQKKVQVIFEKQEEGLAVIESREEKKKDKHKKVYREIARKIHPDKLETSDPRFWEYTNAFKDVNRAIEKENWGDLFEVVDRYNIWLTEYDEACEDIQNSIDETKSLIQHEKKVTHGLCMSVKKTRLVKKESLKIFFINFSGGKANNFTIYSHYEGLLWKSLKNNCNKLLKKRWKRFLLRKKVRRMHATTRCVHDTMFGHLHMLLVL